MGYAAESAPAKQWRVITPSNTVNLPAGCRGIYVGGAGDIALVGEDLAAATFSAVPVGSLLPCGAKRVNVTGTTATLLIALY